VIADLTSGTRFILTHPAISFIILAMAFATFAISCFSPLIAIFVRDLLRDGARTFGVVSAMIGLGTLMGTQLARKLASGPSPVAARRRILASLTIISAGVVVMGGAASAIVLAAGACAMGAGVGLLMAPAQTIIQLETPVDMLGRVSSSVMSMLSLAQILGLVLSGALAAATGLRTLFFSSAFILAGLAIAGVSKLENRA
jgi:DHA3 family macrolide efflux protein-like MFS transporter